MAAAEAGNGDGVDAALASGASALQKDEVWGDVASSVGTTTLHIPSPLIYSMGALPSRWQPKMATHASSNDSRPWGRTPARLTWYV